MTFSRADFKAIVKPTGLKAAGQMRIDARGVWTVKKTAAGSTAEGTNVLLWHPQIEVWQPGLPSPDDVPSLRFPFTPAQLAAFMVAGCGYWLQEFYGDFDEGLDDRSLNKLGDRGVAAKAALKAAYEAYRIVNSTVVPQDLGLVKRYRVLHKLFGRRNSQANRREGVFETGITSDEYSARRSRARQSVAQLGEQCREAKADQDKDAARWRKEIVRSLLSTGNTVHLDAPSAIASDDAPILLKAPLAPNAAARHIHTTKGRTHLLDSIIKQAQALCPDTDRWNSVAVWVHIESFAARDEPLSPLIGLTSGGVQYRDGGQTETLTKRALSDRFRRAKAR